MKRFAMALIISTVVLLGAMASLSSFSVNNASVAQSHEVTPMMPMSVIAREFQGAGQPHSLQVNDMSSMLPSSYTTDASLSALNGAASGANSILVVGGSTNYGNIWTPMIGIYTIHGNSFTDLTNEFVSQLSASTWYLLGAAWDGNSFLITGMDYSGSSLSTTMVLYNPHSGVFTDLSSQIPVTDSGWILSGVAWTGNSFIMVGYAASDSSPTGVQAVMASYNGHTFTDLSANIPTAYDPDYFLGIAEVANRYLITGWTGYDSYPSSAGTE